MRKNRIAVILLSVILTIAEINQVCFAFPSILDDVPEKQILVTETSLGTFSDDDVLRAFRLLNYTGIISENEKDFEEDADVTRGYAVSAFAAMLAGSRAEGSAETFSDVPQNHVYAAGINQALEYGILDNSVSKFYPNKNASYDDVAVWALKALKFDVTLSNKKPLTVANEMGIFKGVGSTGSSITKGKFLRILENALNADLVDMNMSGDGFTYKVDNTKTYLGERYNVYLQEGIVTGYKYSSIYGDIELEDGEVQINRATYKISEELSVDYVGYNVSCYVDTERDNEIIALWQNSGKNNTYEVEKKDYVSADTAYIRYGNSKRISLNGNIRMMKNDLFDGYYSASAAATLPDADKIKVIDNDGDGKGDLLKIYKYTHYIVKSVSQIGEGVVLGNDAGTLDISDAAITEFRLDGKIIDPLTALQANDVLTALEGVKVNGTKVFSADICRDTFDGTISSTGTDEGGTYYVIDGELYYLSDNWISYMTASSSYKNVGDYVQVYLSTDKKIVSIKSEGEFVFGYLMEAKYSRKTDELAITVFKIDGEVAKVTSSEKVRVYNAENQQGKKVYAQEAYNECFDTNGNLKDTAVGYTLDKEGSLKQLAFELPKASVWTGTTYPLVVDLDYNPDGKEDSRVYHGLFARKWTFDGTTPVIAVPENTDLRTNERAYSKNSGNKWGNGEGSYLKSGQIVKAYNSDKFWRPKFYTMKTTVSTSISQGGGSLHFYVIDKICDTYDEVDGGTAKVISYYSGTQYKETKIADDVTIAKAGMFTNVSSADDLKRGDIIQIHTDAVGAIDVLTVYFRIFSPPANGFGSYYYDKETSALTYTTDVSMADVSVVYAKVLDTDSNKALIETSSGIEFPVTIGGYSSYGEPNYLIYDKTAKTGTPAKITDIKPGDTVIMRRYYNHIQDVIILKN